MRDVLRRISAFLHTIERNESEGVSATVGTGQGDASMTTSLRLL